MNRRLLERSRALVVHSRYLVNQVQEAGFSLPVRKIPHGAWIPEVNRNAWRERLGLSEDNPLIGVFGFLKPYKRIPECLRAMKRLVHLDPRVRMILVGEEHPDLPIRRLASQFDLNEHVRVLGYVPIDQFEQLIGAVDICLNLRYPTVGETSGTLLRALGLGRAVLVSDVGAFSEFPDDVCLKVPVGDGESRRTHRNPDSSDRATRACSGTWQARPRICGHRMRLGPRGGPLRRLDSSEVVEGTSGVRQLRGWDRSGRRSRSGERRRD